MRDPRHGFALSLIAALLAGACTAQPAPSAPPTAAVTPVPAQTGGTLTFVVESQPPSFDPHRETSPTVLELVAPFYSVLYRLDPNQPAAVLPDVAQGQPSVSADGLTVTVKLRTDVKFQDGAAMTSADVVATYRKIASPPSGVTSARRDDYAMVDAITAPDPSTVVFTLKRPSAAFKTLLASPWNVIESAAKLAADIRFYEKNVDGTGPFSYVSSDPGRELVGKRNADYFGTDASGTRLPYLDGFRAIVLTDTAARADAVAKKTALIDFEGFAPAQVGPIVTALGDAAAIQDSSLNCVNDLVPNRTRKPFDDVRVRQAVSLAIDRYGASAELQKTTPLRDVGALMRPKSRFELGSTDLQALKGFGTDAAANRTSAKQLLADAAAATLRFTLLTPDAAVPYDALSAYLIDQWKQAGITVTRERRAPAAYQDALRTGAYDVALDVACATLDEPDIQLARFRGAFGDSALDGMIDAQSKELDSTKRAGLVAQATKYILDDKAYAYPLLWWGRTVPYARELRGWRIQPGAGAGQDLGLAWLAR